MSPLPKMLVFLTLSFDPIFWKKLSNSICNVFFTRLSINNIIFSKPSFPLSCKEAFTNPYITKVFKTFDSPTYIFRYSLETNPSFSFLSPHFVLIYQIMVSKTIFGMIFRLSSDFYIYWSSFINFFRFHTIPFLLQLSLMTLGALLLPFQENVHHSGSGGAEPPPLHSIYH